MFKGEFMTTEKILNLGLVKISALALELGVPESTIRTWIRRGDIPPACIIKIGGTVFVIVAKLKECMERM